ncbi:MAG: sulfurtransferase TusA family protein [Syntrophobacteraceae bacterium]
MQTDEKLDLCGVIAPYCFLLCKSALSSLEPGAVLEICLSDRQSLDDLLVILDRSGEKILTQEQHGGFTRIRVQKGMPAWTTCANNSEGAENA